MADATDRLSLLLNLGRCADGEAAAREALGHDPEYAAGYTFLALFLLNQGRAEPAVAAARDGVKRAPRDPWAHAVLAYALAGSNQPERALDAAHEALRLDPTCVLGHQVRCQALCHRRRFRDAERAAWDGLAHHPIDEQLVFWLAWSQREQGEWDRAIDTAEQGLRVHPRSADLRNVLGCALWQSTAMRDRLDRLRAHRRAEAAFREAVRLAPADRVHQENRRNNAIACRRHVLWVVLIPLGLASFAALTVGLAQAAAAGYGGSPCFVLPGLALYLFGVLRLMTAAPFLLGAPLGWLGVPTVPLARGERWKGRAWWFFACAGLVGAPAAAWLFALAAAR